MIVVIVAVLCVLVLSVRILQVRADAAREPVPAQLKK